MPDSHEVESSNLSKFTNLFKKLPSPPKRAVGHIGPHLNEKFYSLLAFLRGKRINFSIFSTASRFGPASSCLNRSVVPSLERQRSSRSSVAIVLVLTVRAWAWIFNSPLQHQDYLGMDGPADCRGLPLGLLRNPTRADDKSLGGGAHKIERVTGHQG
jgi:hypothetical protein